jgi:cupin 2 domain-containing protein
MTELVRGSLDDFGTGPETGERIDEICRLHNVVIEHVYSAQLDAPIEFLQEHDEWVVVLRGHATLEVEGEVVLLDAGDWVLLPARTAHRVLHAERGTRWLAVHVHPSLR